MNSKHIAGQLIRTLNSYFHAECPCCSESIALSHCGLFYLDDFTDDARQLCEENWQALVERRTELRERRKHMLRSSEVQSRATNIGFMLEQLAPVLGGFRFQCSDCRSIFDPIDYVIFEGLCETGRVSRILFTDIKTGASRLSPRQRVIRDLVRQKQVEFDVYEVPKCDPAL